MNPFDIFGLVFACEFAGAEEESDKLLIEIGDFQFFRRSSCFSRVYEGNKGKRKAINGAEWG